MFILNPQILFINQLRSFSKLTIATNYAIRYLKSTIVTSRIKLIIYVSCLHLIRKFILFSKLILKKEYYYKQLKTKLTSLQIKSTNKLIQRQQEGKDTISESDDRPLPGTQTTSRHMSSSLITQKPTKDRKNQKRPIPIKRKLK